MGDLTYGIFILWEIYPMGAFFPICTEGVLFCSYLVDRRFDLWEI